MMKKSNGKFPELKAIRFSLFLKIVIIVWSFAVAVQSESFSVAVMYLVVSIVFAGLFVFQLNYYRKKRSREE